MLFTHQKEDVSRVIWKRSSSWYTLYVCRVFRLPVERHGSNDVEKVWVENPGRFIKKKYIFFSRRERNRIITLYSISSSSYYYRVPRVRARRTVILYAMRYGFVENETFSGRDRLRGVFVRRMIYRVKPINRIPITWYPRDIRIVPTWRVMRVRPRTRSAGHISFVPRRSGKRVGGETLPAGRPTARISAR